MDDDNQVSFAKLVEIVIMISSSQSGHPGLQPTSPNERVQHHVILSFPNPQTQNSAVISTAEELLQLMARYKAQQQLTLIAKVHHETVPKPDPTTPLTSPIKPSARVSNSSQTSLRSPVRKPSLPIQELTVPNLEPVEPLQFDPPTFDHKDEHPTLVSLMEQLLEIQSQRMQQFANHMDERFQQIVEQRLVTSEDQLKQALRDTVQLVEEDCKEDDASSEV